MLIVALPLHLTLPSYSHSFPYRMREQVERLQPGTLDPAMKLDLQTGIRVILETFYKASGQSWVKTEEAMQAAFKTDVRYICVYVYSV